MEPVGTEPPPLDHVDGAPLVEVGKCESATDN
jgi:hypothetical protein